MEHKDYSFLFSQEPKSDPYSANFLVLNFQVPVPLLILAKQVKLKNGAVLINLCIAFRRLKKWYNFLSVIFHMKS
jgi:hypothetical protein